MPASKSKSPANPTPNSPAEGGDQPAPGAAEGADKAGDQPLAENSPGSIFLKKLVTGEIGKPPGKTKKAKADEAGGNEPAAGAGDDDPDGKPAPDKPKTRPKPAAAPVRAIDEAALGEAVGRAIAPHLKAAGKETGQPEKDHTAELTPQQRKRYEIFQHLETLNPDRKGVAARLLKSIAEARKYAEKWEEDHPGQEFNEDDEEHSDQLDQLDAAVGYEEDEIEEARIDLRAEKKIAERSTKITERLDGIERAERARQNTEHVTKFGMEAGAEFWKDMGDDYAAVIDAETGRVNPEQVAALKTADPITFKIVAGAASASELAARTVFMLENDLTQFDPKDELHRFLTGFLTAKEAAMMQRAEAEREHDGRQFAPRTEYANMTKAQRDRHWTFDADDLRFMLRKHFAKVAKDELAEEEQNFSARAKARGLISDDDETHTAGGGERGSVGGRSPKVVSRTASDNEDEDDDAVPGKPSSPTAPSSPKLAATKGAKSGGPQTAFERYQAKFLS